MGTFFFLEIKTSKPSPGLLNPFLIRLILNEKVPKKRVESNFLDIFQQMLKNSPQNSLCAVCACSYKNSKRLVAPLESAKTFEGASYAPGSKTVDASSRWPRKLTYHIISPQKVTISKGKILFQPSMFKGYVSFQESIKGGPQRAKEDQNDSFFVKILKNSSFQGLVYSAKSTLP